MAEAPEDDQAQQGGGAPADNASTDNMSAEGAPDPRYRLSDVELVERQMVSRSRDVEHERQVAIYDLLEDNYFHPDGAPPGPYALKLEVQENRLHFDISLADGDGQREVVLALSPFRKIVKDYFLICESYYEAIRTATPQAIEAIDMGRRGIHNEGAQKLRERLKGKIEVDEDTSRRLFTLICVLHIKG